MNRLRSIQIPSLGRELIVLTSVLLFMLAHETFFLYEKETFWLVIKLGVPVVLLWIAAMKRVNLEPSARHVVTLYLLFIAYGHVCSLFSEDIGDSVAQSYKYFSKIVFAIALIGLLHRYSFSQRTTSIWIVLGTLFSTQAIALVVLITSGAPISSSELIFTQQGFGADEPFVSFGLLGYGNFYQLVGDSMQATMVIRAQGYFSEASNLARFLVVPMFLSLGAFIVGRKFHYLLICLLCVGAILVTRSLTVISCVLITAAVFLVERSPHLLGKTVAALIVVPTVGLLMFGAWSLMLNSFNPDPSQRTLTQTVVGREDKSIDVRSDWIASAIRIAMDHPMGIGFVSTPRSVYLDPSNLTAIGTLPIAPIAWLLRTGVIGLILMLMILAVAYLKARQYLARGDTIMRYVALAFVAQLLIQVVHGNWIDPMFLTLIAMLVAPQEATLRWEQARGQTERVSASAFEPQGGRL